MHSGSNEEMIDFAKVCRKYFPDTSGRLYSVLDLGAVDPSHRAIFAEHFPLLTMRPWI